MRRRAIVADVSCLRVSVGQDREPAEPCYNDSTDRGAISGMDSAAIKVPCIR